MEKIKEGQTGQEVAELLYKNDLEAYGRATEVINNYERGYKDEVVTTEVLTGYYINAQGSANETSNLSYKSMLEYSDLKDAKKIKFEGDTGLSGHLVFYKRKEVTTDSVVLAISVREGQVIEVPEGANYVRTTWYGEGSLTLLGVLTGSIPVLNLVGEAFEYERGQLKACDVITDKGVKGRLIYSDWNEKEQTFSGYTATLEDGTVIKQPPVTFNDKGQITNYPYLIITK